MIRATQLSKRFGSFTAITDVSFEVARGEIVGFLGPNGAGKSTTMRILCGVFPPSRGRAEVAGHDVVLDSLQARAVIGYFPERASLYLDMTVREYLRYVAEMKSLPSAQHAAAIGRAMEACAVDHVAHRLIGNLSKGFRQRVGIAQALVGRPQVLILDEPTSGLDPEQVAEMRHLIHSLRGDSTVIVSSHILSEIEATCDRVLIMNRGRVLAADTPSNLNRRLRRTSQVHLEIRGPATRAQQALQRIAGILQIDIGAEVAPGVASLTVSTEKDRDARADISSALVQNGIALLELRTVTLSLEDIFLSLVHTPGQADHEVSRRLPA